jgi:signal transduction histidine kinase
MPPRPSRSISLPIILSSVAVALSLALLVGWTLLIVRNPALAHDIIANRLLLGTGIGGFIVIVTVLVLFSVFLVREIDEVQRQTSFIDSVTHELKSPLAALKLCLETLGREDLPQAQRERLRGMMLDDVDRLAVFIERVLTASRLAQEQRALPLQEVGVAAAARRAAATILRRHRAPEGAVSIEIADDLVISSDELALATILENLIDNALKYGGSEAAVTVRVTAHTEGERWLVIEVRLKRVFERFYRVQEEHVRSRHGTGLGLYVVSELARLLGGRVEARSPGPGRGTTMAVTLPRRRRA